MRTFFKYMKKRQNELEISGDQMLIFDNIINEYFVPGRGSNDGDKKFMEAMQEHLTYEQRIRLWEKSGACRGTAYEKGRKEFAARHADKPLPVKFDLYIMEYGNNFTGKTRNLVLNEKDNTITITFACGDCYKHYLSGKHASPYTIYYESCAGGRMQNIESALGIKLKIKSIDIPSDGVSVENPCVFTFKIID